MTNQEFKEMSLIDHLTELRKRLLWSFIYIIIIFVICFYFASDLFYFLAKPLVNLLQIDKGQGFIYTALQEAFFTELKIAFFFALFFAFPLIAIQIWRFIAPGLYKNEKRAFLPYNDPSTLKLFLKTIQSNFSYSNSEKLGDAFEYLLSILGTQGDAGQFRTPRHIIDFIAACVNPQKGDTICDPACGTSGFIISAYKHILKNKSKNDHEIIEILDDISRDLNNYDLEFRIQELESKFSRDLSEATFNELKELKKKQNIN